MFKGSKYSIIFITHISSFFRFLVLSTSTVRMSEGTFCRVEVQLYAELIIYVYEEARYSHVTHMLQVQRLYKGCKKKRGLENI